MPKIIKDIKKYQYNQPQKRKNFYYSSYLNSLFVFLFVSIFFYFSQSMVAAPGYNWPTVIINKKLLAQNNNQDLTQRKKQLEQELQSVLNKIEEYRQEINKLSKEKRNLQEEIRYLDAQIKKAELEIQYLISQINNLNRRIESTKKAILLTQEKIDSSKNNLKKTIRMYYQSSKKSVVEVVLAESNLSDYFSNIVFLNKLQESINDQLIDLNKLNNELNYQKNKLEENLEEQKNLLQISELKKQELNELQEEKNEILKITQGEEKKFRGYVSDLQKRAAQIRQELFRLAGGAGPITFEKALEYAELASQLTGIRPAFLLAILKQESDLGRNVGQCYVTNLQTGDGVDTSGRFRDRVMHPTRDIPVFIEITKELGLDYTKTPVSCPLSFGWGGAMGPAQFIPSTWKGYKNKIEKILGEKPNPWNIYHAFIASAVKLTDAGADNKTYNAEWKAAMIYFA
ncbi:MAG: lytic murein transglycosylase, partial [Patescibacteria group bacterium]|nr:lytic murein transglycosylase [Patescibacteria group bacterium]